MYQQDILMQLFSKIFSLLITIAIIISCNTESDKKDDEKILQHHSFRQAAEFEQMDAIWLLYPQITHKNGFSNEAAEAAIIKALVPSVKIKWIVPNDSIRELAIKLIPDSLIKNGLVTFFIFPYSQFWARDMGPAFLINDNGEKGIADFNFNIWGYADTTDAMAGLDEKLDERIAAYYKLPLISTNMVSEGGDHEVNGKGTLIVCEAVEKQRNPNMTLQQMETELKRVLGVEKVIWLQQGVRDDDETFLGPVTGPGNKPYYTTTTTNGHVDEYARFVNDSTILLAWIDSADRKNDIERMTGERMAVNYQILKNAAGQDGKPFHIKGSHALSGFINYAAWRWRVRPDKRNEIF